MKEDFLHYIWQFKQFNSLKLSTTDKKEVSIIKVGEKNTNAGPDFLNAKIKIGTTVWAGNVEIHVNSSDWNKHKHQNDAAYNNVILHVVFNDDIPILTASNREIPTLELSLFIAENLYQNYTSLLKSKQWVPCQGLIQSVDKFTLNNWLERILFERLERKSEAIKMLLKEANNDWSTTFYIHLTTNFGFKINNFPFELLAKSMPLVVLGKHKNNIHQIEALLFGQAGMLQNDFKEAYPSSLKKEYEFLKHKFNLQPIETHLWKYLRLRPPNFPSIRIAELAQLIFTTNSLFSKIIEANSLSQIKEALAIKLSGYWDTHYQLDKTAPKRKKNLGKSSIDILIINTIIPFIFTYGKNKKRQEYIDKALQFLEELSPEKNAIINKWAALKIDIPTAFQSQALLELKNEYCAHKKCLNCGIGSQILKQN